MLNDWYQKGWFGKNYFSLTGDQQALLLAKGEAGMAPNGTFSFDNMVAAFKQTGQELGVAPLPSLREGVPYPLYVVGSGSTMSINKNSANPDAACSFLDYLYSDAFYDKISKDWPGDWNLPLTSINEERLTKNVSPLFAATFARFAKGVADGNYGYTTWTFWPPATEDVSDPRDGAGLAEADLDRGLPEEDADDLRPGNGGRQSAGNRPALNGIIRRGGRGRPFRTIAQSGASLRPAFRDRRCPFSFRLFSSMSSSFWSRHFSRSRWRSSNGTAQRRRLRRARQFSDHLRRSGLLFGATQQHQMDFDFPHHSDRDGILRRLDAACGAPRTNVLSGRLFPAGHHRDRGCRARLAGNDLQSGIGPWSAGSTCTGSHLPIL